MTDNRRDIACHKSRLFLNFLEVDTFRPIGDWLDCRNRGVYDDIDAKVCDASDLVSGSLREVLDGQS